MHGSSKPNYIAFALLLGILMILMVLIIPMRPSNVDYLSSQESKDLDTLPVLADTIISNHQDSDTAKIDTAAVFISQSDSIDTATTPAIIPIPQNIKPIEKPKPLEIEKSKEKSDLGAVLGTLLLTIFMVLLLAYAVFKIVTKRWEYREEKELMAKINLNSPIATASYEPSDWDFKFVEIQNAPPTINEPLEEQKKDNLAENKTAQTRSYTANIVNSTPPLSTKKTMPLWLKDLLFSPFIIAISLFLAILSGFVWVFSLFAGEATRKNRVAKVRKHIDFYGIDVPSALTLSLFAWTQYLMFPSFPFHSNWLYGLILLPIVYLPLYSLPALYRIWRRNEGDLGMWATAILWNLVLFMVLLVYGLMKLLEGQEGNGDNTYLYIVLAMLVALFFGRRWYNGRQTKPEIGVEVGGEEEIATVEEIKEEVTTAIEQEEAAEEKEERLVKPKSSFSALKWGIGVVLGSAFFVFLFEENLLGLDQELNNSLQGGLLVLVVMVIAFFASNGNKKTTDSYIALDEDELDLGEDLNNTETEIITAPNKTKTLQKIDPAIFLEPEWWLKVDLARLGMIDMSHQNLDEDHPFMPYLMDCVNLKTLYLNGNNFEEIPFEIFELSQLKTLELKDNNIFEIHTDIKFLDALNILDLTNNKIEELPTALGELESLKLLAIKDNPITKTDIEAFQATSPKLVIEHNAEEKEPIAEEDKTNTKDLIKVKRLLKKQLNAPHRLTYMSELYDQKLSSLPSEVLKEFKNLAGIYLVGNEFKEIPQALYQLPKLKNVFLGNNQITEIPDQIIELKTLNLLSLSKNPLTKVSMNITKLPALRQLYLDYAQLKSFPMWVTQIATLKELSLHGNHIKKIPEEITQLKQLEDLDLGFANMMEIPDFLCKMDTIQVLNWSGNNLEHLPKNFNRLLNLRELNISFNPKLKLDENLLKQFPYLKLLHLGAMEYDWVPKFIPNLTFLNSLWLNDNKLTNLPYDFDNLAKLKVLSLSGNKFKELPESIGNLSELDNLYLDGNELESLPESIKRLRKLRRLSIRDNALDLSAKRDLQRWLPYTQIDF